MVKNVRDIIALVLLLGIIPAMWLVPALISLQFPDQVTGALIMAWGLVLQFYFRKAGTNGGQ